MAQSTNSSSYQQGDPAAWYRKSLGRTIIYFSLGVVAVLGITAIIAVAASSKESSAAVKDILSLLLPVISVWVGTILAFYYGKENYETAAKSTADLVKQLTPEEKLKSIPAKSVMIPIEKASKLILDKPEDQMKLSDIIKRLDTEKKKRLPIMDTNGCIKFIAHRSTVDQFIVQKAFAGKQLTELTLKDLIDDKDYHNILTAGFGTINPSASLADAKILIDKIDLCLDVFITEDGTAQTKVIGWITNVIITEQARV